MICETNKIQRLKHVLLFWCLLHIHQGIQIVASDFVGDTFPGIVGATWAHDVTIFNDLDGVNIYWVIGLKDTMYRLLTNWHLGSVIDIQTKNLMQMSLPSQCPCKTQDIAFCPAMSTPMSCHKHQNYPPFLMYGRTFCLAMEKYFSRTLHQVISACRFGAKLAFVYTLWHSSLDNQAVNVKFL